MSLDSFPELFFVYLSNILTSPISPLINIVKYILSIEVNFEPFIGLYVITLYLFSVLYCVLIGYIGLNFINSSHDPIRRFKAKRNLKDLILMIFLIQISYLLYYLLVEFSTSLSVSLFSLIKDDFFIFSSNNLANLSSSIIVSFLCVISIIFLIIFLFIRYTIVSLGLILFPLGIFFYFTPGLKAYARIIFNLLFVFVFINPVISFVILGFSKIADNPFFYNYKIIIFTGLFFLIDLFIMIIPILGIIGGKNEL